MRTNDLILIKKCLEQATAPLHYSKRDVNIFNLNIKKSILAIDNEVEIKKVNYKIWFERTKKIKEENKQ